MKLMTREAPQFPDASYLRGSATARPFVPSRKGLTRDELANLLGNLRMKPVIGRAKLVEEAKGFLIRRYGCFDGEVTDRALWSYVRHYFTNYDEIRAAVKARAGQSELYQNVKVYLCCRIIREYGLNVDPLYAAFGENGDYGQIPDRFIVDNLDGAAAHLMLQEFLPGR